MHLEIVRPPAARVHLLSLDPQAAQLLSSIVRGYEHTYSPTFEDPGGEQEAVQELSKTSLQGPLEMLWTVWLLQDVTRAFTHQLVRYRIGTSFLQESLRFSEKRDAKVLATTSSPIYAAAAIAALQAYWQLLDSGIPAEDARGILPTNILTSIYCGVSVRTLTNIWEQRMCLQAQQGEWEHVLQQMRDQLPPFIHPLLKMRCEKVVGACLFLSKWDRQCPLRIDYLKK